MRFASAVFLLSIIIIIFIPLPINAQNDMPIFKVKYISSEHIYINGGNADGIILGDTLEVYKGDSIYSVIQVEFLSEHSSSCKILAGIGLAKAGLNVRLISFKNETTEPVEPQEDHPPLAVEALSRANIKKDQSKTDPVRIKGRAALQLYVLNDQNSSNLDLIQPTFRFDFHAQNLWGGNYEFKIKSRTRYTDRAKRYNSNVSSSEWRNRMYEVSLNYGVNKNGIGFRMGRVIAGSFSGVGYIDGVMIYDRFSNSLEFGAFAGTQPQWQYGNVQTSLQKYGAYINFKNGHRKNLNFESTMALAAEYHSSDISREFLHFKNRISNGSIWNLYQNLDLDINRGWRKEKSGQAISVSNIFISANVRPHDWLRLGLNFDNRKRYWTYELQTLDEQLFDSRNRRGLRGTLYIKLPRNYNLSSAFGYRAVEKEAESAKSWSANLRKTSFTGLRLFWGARYTVFTGKYNDGSRFAFNAGKYFGASSINMEYGQYSYKYSNSNSDRTSQWANISLFLRTFRQIYFSLDNQLNNGDDLNGYRVITEIGYRF